jgi:hypothetical protein
MTDDAGQRIAPLNRTAYFSYSRVTHGIGTMQVGLPYREFRNLVWPAFVPDRRIEIWRAADVGIPLRLEGSFFLRTPKIYTRETDNVDMIEFFGNSPIDLLKRRWVIQAAGTASTAKTDEIDDMMKEIVREQMLWGEARDKDGNLDAARAYPTGEFTVQGDLSLGPSITKRFADRNVLDLLRELKDTSFQLHEDDSANRKIYFDIVPAHEVVGEIAIFQEDGFEIPILDEATGDEILDESSSTSSPKSGFQFQTFADLRGRDLRDRLTFSVANNNLKGPYYRKDHFDEKNSIIVKGQGRGESRAVTVVTDTARSRVSRWNLCEEIYEAGFEVNDSELENAGAAQLKLGQPREELYAIFLNTPGSESTPRSLYGVDWDLGDLVNVWYAEQLFECEIAVVYVGVNEQGIETITGRNTVEAVE